MLIFETIALGFVCWLVTTVVVESEAFRPVREWVDRKYDRKQSVFWYKLRYLVGCHLCAGIWLGLIIAALTPWIAPLATGIAGVVLNGLLYKAIGHCVLIWQKYMEAHSRDI